MESLDNWWIFALQLLLNPIESANCICDNFLDLFVLFVTFYTYKVVLIFRILWGIDIYLLLLLFNFKSLYLFLSLISCAKFMAQMFHHTFLTKLFLIVNAIEFDLLTWMQRAIQWGVSLQFEHFVKFFIIGNPRYMLYFLASWTSHSFLQYLWQLLEASLAYWMWTREKHCPPVFSVVEFALWTLCASVSGSFLLLYSLINRRFFLCLRI